MYGLKIIGLILGFIGVGTISSAGLTYFTLIASGEASKVASYTFLIPLIAIFASAIFMNESITLNLLAGLLMIVVSIVLVNVKMKSTSSIGAVSEG